MPEIRFNELKERFMSPSFAEGSRPAWPWVADQIFPADQPRQSIMS